nr:glycosyltransferase family 87 protein [uncultured Flavobacterium sp.]
MKSVVLKYYPLLPLVLLCVYFVFKATAFPVHDFANYYFGGKFLADGHFNSDIYFPYKFNKAIFDLGHSGIFASYAPNTPFLAVLFSGFSIFPLATAKLIFNCISIVLFVFSIHRLFSHYKIDFKYALLIPILFLVPIKNNLLFGQVYFLLFFLLAEGWLAYEKEQWKLMSLFWSLAILLKVFPVLLVALLVFKKEWKPLSYLMIFCLSFLGISVLFNGFDLWIFYLKEVLSKASKGEIATAFVSNYQSVFMFLKELLVFDTVENPKAFFNYPILFSAVLMAFKIGVLAIGYFVSRKTSNALFVFAYWILAMLILSPYGSTYSFILLLFPFLTLLKIDLSLAKKALLFGTLFLINNVPLSFFIDNTYPFSYLRLFASLAFFVGMIALTYKSIRWKTVFLASLIPMVLMLVFQKKEVVESKALFKEKLILAYDYEIVKNNENNENYIKCSFWDGEEKAILWNPNIKSFQPLELKNNQIFYKNQQLTFDKSHKRKPMLIDHQYILYLSDYDRGIGFFTLRKKQLH